MKVLFLCHRFPLPPDGGAKIRSLYVVRHLLAAGHDVTVCSLLRSPAEERGATELGTLGARVVAQRVWQPWQWVRMLMSLVARQPVTFGYFRSSALQRRITELLAWQQWDLVLAYCSSMAGYVEGFARAPKVIDFVDMDSQKWADYSRTKPFPAQQFYALEARRLERAERQFARSFDFATTISPNELDTLRRLAGDAPSDWFPNGVDLEYFRPSQVVHDPNLIVFVGRMDYYPNEQAMVWFCDVVWSLLRARHPALKLEIVGADPPASVRKLARLPGVTVTGFVPDVRPHVQLAAATVAPLLIARGMQNKVLECMAMGVPVVATARVANGLGLGADAPVRVADTPEQYVAALSSLIESPELRKRVAAESRACVEARFSWSAAMRKLDEIIAAVTSEAVKAP